jgi:membrane associated rhomboid family serine protease
VSKRVGDDTREALVAESSYPTDAMNEPSVQIAVPAFSRAMRALSALLVVVWIATALVSRPDAGSTPDPLGPFAVLSLIPSRVAHFEVWRLITHALVHDPAGVQSIAFSVLGLWLFGGPMESRWGLKRTLASMAVATVVSALLVVAIGALFAPFWTQRAYGAVAATAMLTAAWGITEGARPTSFMGLVTLTGRQFTAIMGVVLALGFLATRSPGAVLSLGGFLVGAVLGNTRAPRAPRERRDSGPKLRVIRGGVDPRDLPN